LYLAFGFAGAFAETVLRNPAPRLVSAGSGMTAQGLKRDC